LYPRGPGTEPSPRATRVVPKEHPDVEYKRSLVREKEKRQRLKEERSLYPEKFMSPEAKSRFAAFGAAVRKRQSSTGVSELYPVVEPNPPSKAKSRFAAFSESVRKEREQSSTYDDAYVTGPSELLYPRGPGITTRATRVTEEHPDVEYKRSLAREKEKRRLLKEERSLYPEKFMSPKAKSRFAAFGAAVRKGQSSTYDDACPTCGRYHY
jgi:hypothetical protein